MTSPKRIGIAIVEQAGRYLVGIRGPDIPLPGFAEFPGGKCHDGESPSDCAVRECREESGLEVLAQRLLHRLEFEYPHGRVDLSFILCHPCRTTDIREKQGAFNWVAIDELKAMTFPEANATVIEMLTNHD